MMQAGLEPLFQAPIILASEHEFSWQYEINGARAGVVLLQTENVLRRPYVLLQLYAAIADLHYPLVCVNIIGRVALSTTRPPASCGSGWLQF